MAAQIFIKQNGINTTEVPECLCSISYADLTTLYELCSGYIEEQQETPEDTNLEEWLMLQKRIEADIERRHDSFKG